MAEPDLIDRLNARYLSSAASCSGGTTAVQCSGVMLRGISPNNASDFWILSPAAKELGSSTFSFFRHDARMDGSDMLGGIIFMDFDTARQRGKNLPQLRCIYPFKAATQGMNRPLHGCGFPNSQANPRPDESTCATLADPAITSAKWIAHFKTVGSDTVKQCSLSTQEPAQLITSLQARQQLDEANYYLNELLIAAWDETKPEALPIEAFFFNRAKQGAFDHASTMQKAYYQKTQIWRPIVALNSETGDNKFVTRLTEIEEGKQTSNALNLRYANTRDRCGSNASLDCNGVIIRTAAYAAGSHVWNPGEKHVKNNGVAFSYIRADSGINVLAWNTRYQGFIFKQLDSLREPGSYQLQAACIFPTDGSTDSRTQACGAHKSYPTGSETCASQGITTLAQFKTHFQSVAQGEDSGYFNNRNKHQCSLPTSQAGVDISMKARNNDTLSTAQRAHHNELIIRAWSQNIPNQLPLEAFFWWNPNNDASGLAQAKDMQRDLVRTAAKWIPVVRLNFKTTNPDQIFMYAPEDQACTRTTCN